MLLIPTAGEEQHGLEVFHCSTHTSPLPLPIPSSPAPPRPAPPATQQLLQNSIARIRNRARIRARTSIIWASERRLCHHLHFLSSLRGVVSVCHCLGQMASAHTPT